MKIKTPAFWYRDKENRPKIWEHLLSPLSHIYKACDKKNREKQIPLKVDVPVMCVGNLTAGGSGKTPTAIALANMLVEKNIVKNPYFVTRGYGGSNKKTRRITVHDTPSETGDEPILLVKHCKTIVSVNRYDGAQMAAAEGADLVILDDGFQNNSLHKDISILVIDGKRGFGNRKILPAGPLREAPNAGFKKADIVIIIGDDQHKISQDIPEKSPVFFANVEPRTDQERKQKNKYIAFAGLGIPEKFKDTLIENNYSLIDFIPFPDHYKYKEKELEQLLKRAETQNATLITTEKDILRIPPKYSKHIQTLPIRLRFEQENTLSKYLEEKINTVKAKKRKPHEKS